MEKLVKLNQKLLNKMNIINEGFEGILYLSKCKKKVYKVFRPERYLSFNNELKSLKKLKKEKHIINYLNYRDDTFKIIEYPYYHYGDVYLFCKNNKSRQIKKICLKNELTLNKLWTAIKNCHDNGVCHRDIKIDNLLIDYNYNKKQKEIILNDFGLSYQRIDNISGSCGTYNYVAPEIYKYKFSDIKYNYKVDIWSAGITWLRASVVNVNVEFNYNNIKLFGINEIKKNYSHIWNKMTPLTQFILENSLQVKPENRLDANKFVELF